MRYIDENGLEKHKGWIYCIEFVGEGKYNGWSYVGQSRRKEGWERRVLDHFMNPCDTYIDRVCQQYDACNFRAHLVAEYVRDTEYELISKLNDCEEYFIHLFGTFRDWDLGGFNLTKGGGAKGVSENVHGLVQRCDDMAHNRLRVSFLLSYTFLFFLFFLFFSLFSV